MSQKFSHVYDLSFSVDSESQPGEDVTPSMIRESIITRLASITDDELPEAVGLGCSPSLHTSTPAVELPDNLFKGFCSGIDDKIYIGLYYSESGCMGNFCIEWDGLGTRLQVYEDAWKILTFMPELIIAMATINASKELKPDTFRKILIGLGYQEIKI